MTAITPADLRALLAAAQAERLPCSCAHRAILPSGGICDDWNVSVRGSVDLLRWARERQNAAVYAREMADLEYLCERWLSGHTARQDKSVRARVESGSLLGEEA